MRRCPDCGGERPDDDDGKYCSFCGIEFETKVVVEKATDLGTAPPPTEIRTANFQRTNPPARTRNPNSICFGIIAVIIVIFLVMLVLPITGIEIGPNLFINFAIIAAVVVFVIIIFFSVISSGRGRRHYRRDCDCYGDDLLCCLYGCNFSGNCCAECGDCDNNGSCDCCDCNECNDCGDCGDCGDC